MSGRTDARIRPARRRPDQRGLDGQAAQPRLPGDPAGLPGAEDPAPAGPRGRYRRRPGRLRPRRPRATPGPAPTTATCSPIPTSTWCPSARRTCCTARSASRPRGPASRSGSRSRSAGTPPRPPRSPPRPGGRRDHLDRLQLPARPRGGTGPRADRGRAARPHHQRARRVLQQLRVRAQRRPVLAVPQRPGRQRRARRPAQPRRRPHAVRRGADHRGQLAAVHRVRAAAHPADGFGPPTSR